jgi:mono/diheme cytochrome c family protein
VEEDQIEFVSLGSENGVGYAPQAQGTGRMPAFGAMLTDEQLEAIVEYVRSL